VRDTPDDLRLCAYGQLIEARRDLGRAVRKTLARQALEIALLAEKIERENAAGEGKDARKGVAA
jgi:hypothetical protein